MSESIDQLWEKRKPDLPITSMREAIVLASIVERETGLATERPRIAAPCASYVRCTMMRQGNFVQRTNPWRGSINPGVTAPT